MLFHTSRPISSFFADWHVEKNAYAHKHGLYVAKSPYVWSDKKINSEFIQRFELIGGLVFADSQMKLLSVLIRFAHDLLWLTRGAPVLLLLLLLLLWLCCLTKEEHSWSPISHRWDGIISQRIHCFH